MGIGNEWDSGGLSRRRFLGGSAALAALGLLGSRPAGAGTVDGRKPAAPVDGRDTDCGCDDAAVPVQAVARIGDNYVGIAGTATAVGLFDLIVGPDGSVSLGAVRDVALPEDLSYEGLAVVGGRLVVLGSVPFTWETRHVDDAISEDARRAHLGPWPGSDAGSGSGDQVVWGYEPAAFWIDGDVATPMELPALARRRMAVASGAVDGGADGVRILIEHNGEDVELLAATGIDVAVRSAAGWSVATVAQNLGESGRASLAASPAATLVATTMGDGTTAVFVRDDRWARSHAPFGARRLLAAVGTGSEIAVYTSGPSGGAERWVRSHGGSWRPDIAPRMTNDDVVDVVAVQGTAGQVVLLGRGSAVLAGAA